jgi:hypothetical protein
MIMMLVKEFRKEKDTPQEGNEEKSGNTYRNMSMTYLDNQIAPFESCNQEVGYDRCVWFEIKEEDRQNLPVPLEDYENVMFSGTLSREERKVIQIDSLVKGSSVTPDKPESIDDNIDSKATEAP